jgi:hypothetical protein
MTIAVTPLNSRFRSSFACVVRNSSNTWPIQSCETATRAMIWLTVGTAPAVVWCRYGSVASGQVFMPAPRYCRLASYVQRTSAAANGPPG